MTHNLAAAIGDNHSLPCSAAISENSQAFRIELESQTELAIVMIFAGTFFDPIGGLPAEMSCWFLLTLSASFAKSDYVGID